MKKLIQTWLDWNMEGREWEMSNNDDFSINHCCTAITHTTLSGFWTACGAGASVVTGVSAATIVALSVGVTVVF